MPKDYFDSKNAAEDEVRRLRRFLQDIADADASPTPDRAFQWCKDLAKAALE